MKLIRKGKISYMQPDWVTGESVIAGFTTRNGGISRPPYNSATTPRMHAIMWKAIART